MTARHLDRRERFAASRIERQRRARLRVQLHQLARIVCIVEVSARIGDERRRAVILIVGIRREDLIRLVVAELVRVDPARLVIAGEIGVDAVCLRRDQR